MAQDLDACSRYTGTRGDTVTNLETIMRSELELRQMSERDLANYIQYLYVQAKMIQDKAEHVLAIREEKMGALDI